MKTTKKLLAVLLSVLMLFSTVAFAASAADKNFVKTETMNGLHFRYDTNSVESITNINFVKVDENGNYNVYFTVNLKKGFGNSRFFYNVDRPLNPELISKDGYTENYHYAFSGITSDDEITVFANELSSYTVIFDLGDGVKEVSPSEITFFEGEKIEFTVTLEEGYNKPYIRTYDGIEIDEPVLVSQNGNEYTYTISNIDESLTLFVGAEHQSFTVKMINSRFEANDDDYENYIVFWDGMPYGSTPEYTEPESYTDDDGKTYIFIGWDIAKDFNLDEETGKITGTFDGIVDAKKIENVTEDIYANAVFELDHNHDSDPTVTPGWELAEIKKGTCTEDGAYVYVCGRCQEGVIKEVTIKARGHKLSPWVTTKAPTCTEKGEQTRACLNITETDLYKACLHIEKAELAPLGHSFGEWVIVTPPTCTEKGKAERTCTNDSSHKEYKDIDAKGHHDSDGDRLCDDCGESFGHCSDCICHKGNVLSYVMRYLCTFLSKMFHTNIKCCECMEWYNDEISSIS